MSKLMSLSAIKDEKFVIVSLRHDRKTLGINIFKLYTAYYYFFYDLREFEPFYEKG